MAQVTVTIAGRTYRMACNEGEEPHLEALAHQIDSRIEELRGSFGEIGDQRLIVMAGISLADELAEARRRIGELEAQIAEGTEVREKQQSTNDQWMNSVADALDAAAARIEGMSKQIDGGTRQEGQRES